MLLPFAIIIALVIDAVFGEPKKFHPLVGFGRLAQHYESKFNLPTQSNYQRFFAGFFGVSLLIVPFVFLSYYVVDQIAITWFFEVLILYWAIGHQSLRQHILDVYSALKEGDITLARQKVSMIVSRDTEQLSAQQLTQATIETGLENGADAIFAPLFWFCLLGAPAVVLYRLVNTLDAMWGYRTNQFEYFGKSAARLDDILNWLPARLVALSYALLGNTRSAIDCWLKQAAALKSPNAGPVMTSGAGSLGVKLGGPTYYHGKLMEKPFFGAGHEVEHKHILQCLKLIFKTLILWCLMAGILSILLGGSSQ